MSKVLKTFNKADYGFEFFPNRESRIKTLYVHFLEKFDLQQIVKNICHHARCVWWSDNVYSQLHSQKLLPVFQPRHFAVVLSSAMFTYCGHIEEYKPYM